MTPFHRRLIGSAQVGWFARARALLLALAIAGTAGSAIVLSPFDPLAGTACAGSGPHHAALVVEHGNGATIRRCVAFSGATITGEHLLSLSEVEVTTATLGGFGQAVCQIDNEPAHFSACLPPSPDPYWVLFVSRAGAPWTLSDLGISSQTFADGDAEGFRYDPQSGTPAPPPAPTPCPSPTAAPTATPRPSSTVAPRATAGTTPTSAATTSSPTSPTTSAASSLALAAGPASSPEASAGSDAAGLGPVSPSPAELSIASSTMDLATAGAVLALVALLAVGAAATWSRSRRTGTGR